MPESSNNIIPSITIASGLSAGSPDIRIQSCSPSEGGVIVCQAVQTVGNISEEVSVGADCQFKNTIVEVSPIEQI